MTDWMKPQQQNMNVSASMSMGSGSERKAAQDAQAPLVKDITTAEFASEVMDASNSVPVLVDFWAPWCGPCKTLGPIIEKAVANAGGAVRLVKMDIDKNPEIPGQMGIQSIPAVVAFVGGRPVDAFMGARPESEVKGFIDKVAKMGPGPQGSGAADMKAVVEEADALFAEKDYAGAAQLYAAVLNQEPGNLDAIAGLGQCYLAVNEPDQARGLLAQVPPEHHSEGKMAAFVKALELAEQASELGDLSELAAAVESDPNNHEARLNYAIALNAAGRRQEAAENLLVIIRKDRAWRDEAARKQLLEFFEAWGNTDPATINARRALSSILFS